MSNKTKTTRVTISLPVAMVKAADRQGKIEMRNRSETMREALRYYLSRIPADEATPAEIAALNRGKKEIAQGNYVAFG
jgi:metal-responsive CopG/Arc/MetJ family transcriptional regulator